MLGVSIKCVREHNDITTLIAKRQGIGLREHTATEVVAVCVGVHRVVNEDAVRNRTGGKRIQSPEADLKGSIAGFVGKKTRAGTLLLGQNGLACGGGEKRFPGDRAHIC